MAMSAQRPDDLRREPILPPGFSLVALRESGDAFAHACTIASEAGAATLVWTRRFDIIEFAVVLEPDNPLREARLAHYLAMNALADALAVHSPPERPILFRWPDALIYDLGLIGGGGQQRRHLRAGGLGLPRPAGGLADIGEGDLAGIIEIGRDLLEQRSLLRAADGDLGAVAKRPRKKLGLRPAEMPEGANVAALAAVRQRAQIERHRVLARAHHQRAGGLQRAGLRHRANNPWTWPGERLFVSLADFYAYMELEWFKRNER